MIAAGEDPRFIARRLIIAASEDVGNADPRALQVAVAAAAALDYVGLPEAQYALAQATDLHRDGAEVEPLGRGLLGGRRGPRCRWRAARADAPPQRRPPRPASSTATASATATRTTSRAPTSSQQYLPDALVERRYYLPNDQGYEATIAARMAGRADAREATRRRGRPEREAIPGPKADAMKAGGSIMKTREEARRKLAETEKRDAGAG